MFIGTAFPNALVSADWRFLADFLCGATAVGGVRFWFCLFGDRATSSEDVVDRLSSEWLDAVFSGPVFAVVFSDISSVRKLIPLVFWNFCAGRLPVLLPVNFTFLFVGLFVCVASFRFFVSFTGRPVFSSSLNNGCFGALEFSMSKKRRHGPDIRAYLYAT